MSLEEALLDEGAPLRMNDLFDSQFIEEMKEESDYVALRGKDRDQDQEMRELIGITGEDEDAIEPDLLKRKRADSNQEELTVCSLLFEYLVKLGNKLVHKNWKVRRNSALLLIEFIRTEAF